MNKYGLISAVAEEQNISKKDAERIIDCCFDTIIKTLKDGDKVQLVGFGCFEVRERASREGRNPQKPEETITIPASKVPAFKAGKSLKEAIK